MSVGRVAVRLLGAGDCEGTKGRGGQYEGDERKGKKGEGRKKDREGREGKKEEKGKERKVETNGLNLE